jgi:choline dehydrogenase-like flavoprotein
LLFALGATRVFPAGHGFDADLTSPARADDLLQAPLDARNYFVGVGHLFGTCRMGGPARGVVGPDFRVHGFDNLFVADGSIFPSNIGVNPMLPIMQLACCAVPRILRQTG